MTLPPLGTQVILVHPIYLQTFLNSRIVGPSKIMVVTRTDLNCFELMIIIQWGFTTISFLYVWTRVGTLSFFIVNIFRRHLFQYHIFRRHLFQYHIRLVFFSMMRREIFSWSSQNVISLELTKVNVIRQWYDHTKSQIVITPYDWYFLDFNHIHHMNGIHLQ